MTVDELIGELIRISNMGGGGWVVGRLDTELYVYESFVQVEIKDTNRVHLLTEDQV